MNANVRALVDARKGTQKLRIAFDNREGAIERGDARPVFRKGKKDPISEKYAKIFADLEVEITKDLIEESQVEPIISQMAELNGINYITASQLCSMIDIEKAPTVSSLWRFAGYGCNESGEIDRLRKGEKACFNRKLKPLLHIIATNFLRCRSDSPFKKVYYDAKKKYQAKIDSGEWEKKNGWKMHVHMASLRKVKKLFLATLWRRWREIEGLPVRSPYVEEYKGHTHIYTPEDFGWPVIIKVKDIKVKRGKNGIKKSKKKVAKKVSTKAKKKVLKTKTKS